MYNTAVLSLITSVLPLVALLFVVVLLMHKFYVQIRSRYNIKVNCWFCNENTKVPYADSNNWHCPYCEQYNGFNKDGDYNREIFQQLDCSNLSSSSRKLDNESETISPTNGFCNGCNEAQRLKVEKLSQFEPKNESHFDKELQIYKAQLEEQYRLCTTCDRHLKKVLREKKKIVLGSKFLDYVMRGANIMKQPHFTQMRQQQKETWKKRFTIAILLCAIINLFSLLTRLTLPTLNVQNFTKMFGSFIGETIFLFSSHLIALLRVLLTYFEALSTQSLVVKVQLFCRTIFLMLLYSLGLKFPQFLSVNFSSLFILVTPYTMLGFAFAHNMIDSFRISRYTLLLGVWSFVAAELPLLTAWLTPNTISLLASFMTCVITGIKDDSGGRADKLHDASAQSFHRLYSEDYLSDCDDDETISLLSQQYNNNSSRVSSHGSMRSFNQRQQISPNARFTKSPLTSSVHSLSNLPRHSIHSANNSFNSYLHPKSIYNNNNLTNNSQFACPTTPTNYAESFYNFGTLQKPFYASNMDLRQPTHAYDVNTCYAGSTITQATPIPATSNLSSPFSSSASVIYQAMPQHQQQLQQPQRILTPSRFSINSLQSNSLWPSQTNYNYNHNRINKLWQMQPQQPYIQNMHLETRVEENISRSSSHSSGFESQSQGVHEQSCGRETDINARDMTFIDQSCKTSLNGHSNTAPRDSFNFQQFDAQLPSYRRGDLLRKWKDTQIIS